MAFLLSSFLLKMHFVVLLCYEMLSLFPVGYCNLPIISFTVISEFGHTILKLDPLFLQIVQKWGYSSSSDRLWCRWYYVGCIICDCVYDGSDDPYWVMFLRHDWYWLCYLNGTLGCVLIGYSISGEELEALVLWLDTGAGPQVSWGEMGAGITAPFCGIHTQSCV
jgi:hypothetical protein